MSAKRKDRVSTARRTVEVAVASELVVRETPDTERSVATELTVADKPLKGLLNDKDFCKASG